MRVIDRPDFRPKKLSTTALWKEIGPGVQRIFGDIPEDLLGEDVPMDMLRACYVTQRCDYERIFAAEVHPGLAVDQVIAFPKPDDTPKKVEEADWATEEPDFFAPKYPPPRVILLVGDVGVGKSTYLWYHKRTTLASSDVFCTIINIGSPATRSVLAESVRQKLEISVHAKIDEIIKGGEKSGDDIQFCLYDDVLRRHEGAIRDAGDDERGRRNKKRELIEKFQRTYPKEKLRREIAFVRTTTKNQVFVMLDEVDRLPEGKMLDYLLDHARDLANDFGVTVVMATRLYTRTFILERKLSGARYLVLTMQPPDFGQVIKKRLDYVSRLIKKDRDFTAVYLKGRRFDTGDPAGFTLEKKDVVDFLKTFCEALLQRRALRCIEHLSNLNVRTALELVATLLESPHLHVHAVTLACRFPILQYDLIHVLGLGSWPRYNPKDSFLLNMWDNDDPDHISTGNSLIKIRVFQTVAYLSGKENARSTPREVINTMKKMGHDEQASTSVVTRFIDKLLIDSDDRTAAYRETLSQVGNLKLTLSGYYYLSQLAWQLRYAEDLQDAIHWPDGEVPYPEHAAESRSGKQKRLEALWKKIKEDEEGEASRVEADERCDKVLYTTIVGAPAWQRLQRAHKSELTKILSGRLDIEGEWTFSQQPSDDKCPYRIGVGVIRFVSRTGSELRAKLDTEYAATGVAAERSGKSLVLQLQYPPIRLIASLDRSGAFSGECDCAARGVCGKACTFRLVKTLTLRD